MIESYLTIDESVEHTLFKEKGSKFIGYAFPVTNEEQVKKHLEELKKEYHNARHWCYAYKLGIDGAVYRVNDDGEPSGTAGQPIYGQILSFEVTNVLIVVVRYFGGVKLGVGGLIKAYRASAQITLESANIVNKIITKSFIVKCAYANMNKIMRVIKEQKLEITAQTLEIACEFTLSVSLTNYAKAIKSFDDILGIEVLEQE